MNTTGSIYYEINLGSFQPEEEGILADAFRAALQDMGKDRPKNPVLIARFYLADADELDEEDS